MKKKGLLSESEKRRFLKLAGVIKEDYEGQDLEGYEDTANDIKPGDEVILKDDKANAFLHYQNHINRGGGEHARDFFSDQDLSSLEKVKCYVLYTDGDKSSVFLKEGDVIQNTFKNEILQKTGEVYDRDIDIDSQATADTLRNPEFSSMQDFLEEDYNEDPVYGDDPMIDSDPSMDADAELGLGDDSEINLGDYGKTIPGVDRGGSEDYEKPPKRTMSNNYDNSLDVLGKAKMFFGGPSDEYDIDTAEELLYKLGKSKESAMDGDVMKAKEIDAYYNKMKVLVSKMGR